ncbi:Glutamyl-tRNA(Gln) amidotransferase, A subunit [Elusimicrobium minutum Pei191]|uniref:Glutamyl-tRNA(Gln) amidotransferase subunit A n=1 Tax=Elusimicrobium minutum (strain Pei191) TaxID=445932 RepID=B2KAT9_ELUMP|nr:Asp-tRNA(Asn)/Glu-tRNA(Gln) amidotransferase subunit GatA [Elusimicrobium minutum]ACC97635.1 Glutamyl-tRNA(Gln) amidotransferase, A subunit [Elusimicrobium minutum Pei191]
MKAFEIVQAVKQGKLTAVEAARASLKIIKEKNPKINAFVEVFEQEALQRAKEIDAKKAAGKELGELAGVPVGIKDNLLYKGHKVTCASKMLLNHTAAYTGTVVQKLIDADAIIIGRLNMDEFAMGSTTENSVYGPTKNPIDHTRVAGGSSGGSAAAVAAGMVPLTLGSDTGGSIRQPASFCGIVGMKPTYGRVSRYGIVAFASSADQIGPLAGDVKDAALLFKVIADFDEKDSTVSSAPVPDVLASLKNTLEGVKVGIPVDFFDNLNPEIKDSFDRAKEILKSLGAELKEISLPFAKYSAPCYYMITGAEASSNLSRFDGVRYGYSTPVPANLDEVYSKTRMEGFGMEVKRRIMIGHYVLSREKYETCLVKAKEVRSLIRKNFKDAFKNVDIILTPTSPTVATKQGAAVLDQVNTYLADLYTCPGNMANLPGISVPAGNNKEGLPIGLQFYTDEFKEDVLFQAAYAYEAAVKGK